MLAAHSLRTIPLFSGLRDDDLVRILRASVVRSHKKNGIIAFESDPEDALYVVVSGTVKLVLVSDGGREVILGIRGPGDFFGEMSLLHDAPRAAHAIAMEDCNLLVLRREHFQRVVEELPAMAIGLLRAMCRRLGQAQQRIGGLALLDARGRVARGLLELADDEGFITLGSGMTQATIAQMVGTSRETVSRTLNELSADGHLEMKGRKIRIVRREPLDELAGLPPGGDRRETERRVRQLPIQFPDRRTGVDRRAGSDRRMFDLSATARQAPGAESA